MHYYYLHRYNYYYYYYFYLRTHARAYGFYETKGPVDLGTVTNRNRAPFVYLYTWKNGQNVCYLLCMVGIHLQFIVTSSYARTSTGQAYYKIDKICHGSNAIRVQILDNALDWFFIYTAVNII